MGTIDMTTDLIEMREIARKAARVTNAPLTGHNGKVREKTKLSFLTAEIGRLLRQLDVTHALIARYEARIEQLESLATTDELTRLRNRRGLQDVFSSELARCARGLSSGGLLVMIDLDNFKTINDTFGHAAGDACLRLVAQTLADEIRTTDSAARLGGDEFVLLLTNATKSAATARIQTIAWELNHLSLVWEGQTIAINASVGLRSYADGDTADGILDEADKAMYVSKKHKHDRASAMSA